MVRAHDGDLRYADEGTAIELIDLIPWRHFTSGCQLHRSAPLVKPGGSLSPCFSRRHYMPDTTNTKSDRQILNAIER